MVSFSIDFSLTALMGNFKSSLITEDYLNNLVKKIILEKLDKSEKDFAPIFDNYVKTFLKMVGGGNPYPENESIYTEYYILDIVLDSSLDILKIEDFIKGFKKDFDIKLNNDDFKIYIDDYAKHLDEIDILFIGEVKN